MKKIIIYGTGAIANFLVTHINNASAQIVAYANSYDYGNTINDIIVINDVDICNYTFDYIIIAFSNPSRGFEKLISMNIERKKIIAFTPMTDLSYLNRLSSTCNADLHSYLNDNELSNLFHLDTINYHLCAMHTYQNYTDIIEHDYVREQTLALLAEEINRKKLSGNVAELGVYKGEFSKKLNTLFPNKTLYLFDTFEGFNSNDIKQDTTLLSETTESIKFTDTCAEKVLSLMPYPEKCILKKGYFPDTYDLEELTFSFVSIDVDLYSPILAGLKIFYPLLEKGGYIMVHDYNSLSYKGTKAAVIEYCTQHNISYVPLCDNCGSIVITK